ncbi:hypothetical protein IWQ60_000531 [Tieghemiomyces parasiticus]|uniref:Queuine tRNA-ribosyltransferase accessory subunit 2 n=1 Tax=Tieghemiomyces parasiticus TaxID=78921 RepID=A0A9W8AFY8_9FUNG|nr:hypothetical protein IWQ60_000531 [Tieghemiomyces parasiticus]
MALCQFQLCKIPEVGLRLGVLTLSATQLERRGLVPHLTPDNEERLTSGILAVFAEHLMRQMLNNRTNWTLLDIRDPALPHVAAPHANKFYRTETLGGIRQLSPAKYMGMVNQCQPEIFVAMAEDLNGPDEAEARIKKSVVHSLAWLDECLRLRQPASTSAAFANLNGSRLTDLRVQSATESARRPVDGFVLNDLYHAPSAEVQLDWITASLAPLPAAKPRLAYRIEDPHQILRAVARGVDLFDASYPLAQADRGHALDFTFGSEATPPSATAQVTSLHHDMNDPIYKSDLTPLDAACPCLACTRYTRAYLYHLHMTKEMLARVLVTLHNLTVFDRFFAAIRASLHRGDFTKEAAEFERRYTLP